MPEALTQTSVVKARKTATVRSSHNDDLDTNSGSDSHWVENTPFYLDGILALLDTLTDEDKEAVHQSFQG